MTGFRCRQVKGGGVVFPTHSLAYSHFVSLVIEGRQLTAWCSLLIHPLWMTRYTICSASSIIYSTWIMQFWTLASFHCVTAFYPIMSTKIDWFNFACAPCVIRKVFFPHLFIYLGRQNEKSTKERDHTILCCISHTQRDWMGFAIWTNILLLLPPTAFLLCYFVIQ